MSNTNLSSLTEDDSVLQDMRGQVAVEWKIKKFLDLPIKDSYCLKSPPFEFSNAEWYMKIYPNGDWRPESLGWISLYLHIKDCPSSVDVIYKIGIKKIGGSVFKFVSGTKSFRKNNTGKGTSKLIQRTDLLEARDIVVPEDVLTVFCRARIKDSSADVGVQSDLQISSLDSLSILQQNLKDLFLNKCHTDVSVDVQGQEFLAHWVILAARSSVFSAMFNHDTTEKQTGTIKVTDCSPESFKDFLHFLYTGQTDVVSSDNAVSLYKTADKYNVQDLKKICALCMEKELSVESICDVIILAAMHDESNVLDTATNFFIENAETILPTTQWQSFLSEHFTIANELLIKMVHELKGTEWD